MTGERTEGAAIDVSVVVPCYNVEGSVAECVRGIRMNDRASLEILLVDDGSTDATAKILAELAERDGRIRVIEKPNGGYGSAVNRGFDEARGRYLAIAEPDDYVAAHMYDELFELAGSYGFPDVVKSSYWRVITGADGTETLRHNDYYRAIRPRIQPFTLKDEPWLLRYHPSIWSAIYRRDFIEGNSIRFKEAPGAGWVDNPFLVDTLARAESIVYTDDAYYHYREDLPGSSSVTLPWQIQFERWHDMMDVLDSLGVDDPEVRRALYVVGFRYAEKALAALPEGSPSHGEALEGARTIFERMDLELVRGLDRVSPTLRSLAFELRGEEPPSMDRLAYVASLIEAGLHATAINGPAFALSYVSRYIDALKGRLRL